MIVKKLFIVSILADNWTSNDDTEIFPGGRALFNKYRGSMSNDNIALFEFDLRVSQPATPAKPVRGAADAAVLEENAGVYVLGHGTSGPPPTLGGLEAPAVAAILKNNVGLKAIRKLVLMSCTLAKTPDPNGIGPSVFISRLCESLKPLTPMIAGWDNYVSVISETTEEFRVSLPGDAFKSYKKGAAGSDAFYGKKVTKINPNHGDKHARTVTTELREQHKAVWGVVDDKVVRLNERWHDRR
jgi:hypothetical protein